MVEAVEPVHPHVEPEVVELHRRPGPVEGLVVEVGEIEGGFRADGTQVHAEGNVA